MTNAATVPPPPPARKSKLGLILGLLAGCLMLFVILGIVAAIAIPSFLSATERARQKGTEAQARALAAALETFHTGSSGYPLVTDSAALGPLLAKSGFQGGVEDGWKRPFRYTCLEPSGEVCASYELASGGRDGVFESEPGSYAEGAYPSSSFDSDLVVINGQFVRQPEGLQSAPAAKPN